MKESIDRLLAALGDNGVDAALISKEANQRYFSGFTGTDSLLLIHPGANYIITDFRYVEQAEMQCPGFRVIDAAGGRRAPFIREVCMAADIRKLWFEENAVSFSEYKGWQQSLAPVDLVPDSGIPEKLRIVKTEFEVNNIKKAAALADAGFAHILKYIRPGVTEREIALELEFFLRKNGSEGLAFPIIAGSGKNGSLPHAEPTDKRIENGEFLTLDFGCIMNGYCSDMTRTVAIGEPGEKLREIYRITLEAQQKALDAIAPGVTGIYVDKQARDHITSKGYGKCFGHGLGHGVGLNVHEAPSLSARGCEPLKPGMVVTVEPGIYIPDFGGVRIEDLVVVTENGFDNLVTSPKDLVIL